MPAANFRAPGMRWPVPRLLTCLVVLSFGLAGWIVFTSLEEEQALDAMFQTSAHAIERVRSAELWSKRGSEGIPRIREALNSPDAKTRVFGLLALAYMPKHDAKLAESDILRLIEDADLSVQADALVLASEISVAPAEIAPLAASRLLSSDQKIVQAADVALRNLGPAAVPSIAAVLPQASPIIQDACLNLLLESAFDEQHGDEAQAAITQCLWSADENVRRRAYELVSAIRAMSSDELSHGLRDSDVRIVKIALKEWSNQKSPDPKELPLLVQLLTTHSQLRVQVLGAIATFGPSASHLAEVIFEWTKSEEAATRRAAAVTFVRLTDNSERVRPILMRMLLDANPHVARQAGQLLAETSPSELPGIVQNVLLPRVQSPAEWIQISAVAALSGMPQAAVEQRLILIRMLASESSEMPVSRALQYELAEALGNMGPEAKEAGPAILSLLQRTSHRDPRIVVPIVALGKIGAKDQEVLSSLMQLRDHAAFKVVSVKLAVIESLGRLGGNDESVLETLSELALHEKFVNTRVAALRATANLEIDAELAEITYSSFLRDENVNVRIAACELLVEKGRPEEIVLDLAKLLMDGNYFVRILAANSLAGIGAEARDAIPALCRAAEDQSNTFAANVTVVEDEEGEIDWDLFDGRFRELNRGSVYQAVRVALAAIGHKPAGMKTAQLERP